MKFYCDSCSAKYLIGDEKVDGKVLRIRCKRCGHVMTVRGPTFPVGAESMLELEPEEHGGTEDGPIEWYYSRSGETFGPYALSVLQDMFGTGQLGDEAYVWKADFPAWLPARDRPEFESYFQQGKVRQPRRPTMNLRAEDLQAALVAVQNQSQANAPAVASAASPAVASPAAASPAAGSGSSMLAASAYRRGERPTDFRSASAPAPAHDASLGAALGRSAATKVASSPSHILKRASDAHARATGSSILSRPTEGGQEATEEAAGALAAPTDRLRALRERLQSRSAPSSQFAAPGPLASSGALKPASTAPAAALSPGPAAAAAPQASSPASSGPDRPRPSSGLSSVGAGLSLKERLEQRDREPRAVTPAPTPAPAPAPVEEDELGGGMVTEIATTHGDTPVSGLHVAVPAAAEEIPELGDDDLEFESHGFAEERPEPGESTDPGLDLRAIATPTRSPVPMSAEPPGLAGLAEPTRPKPAPGKDAPAGAERPVSPMASDALMPLPKGSTAHTDVDDGPASHSLLIQLDEMDKHRRRTWMFALVALVAAVFLGTVGLAAYFTFFAGPSANQQKLAEQARLAREREAANEVGGGDLSDRKGYKHEELEDMHDVIELGADEGAEDEGPAPAEDGAPAAEPTVAPRPRGEAAPKAPARDAGKVGGGVDLAGGLLKDKKDNPLDGALASAGKVESDGDGFKRQADSGAGEVARVGDQGTPGSAGGSGSVFRDIASSGNRERVEVKHVERDRTPDNDAPASLPSTLSKSDLVDGFRNVRHSADQCLERHMKRSGRLPKGKVKVIVTIAGDGAVSDVRMDEEVTNTVFESCMRSHTSRWRFPKFAGEPLHVARVFLLQ